MLVLYAQFLCKLCLVLVSNAVASFLFFCIHLSEREREREREREEERELVALLKSCYFCHLAFSVLCLYLRVTWVVLWSVVVVLLGQAYLLIKTDESLFQTIIYKRACLIFQESMNFFETKITLLLRTC